MTELLNYFSTIPVEVLDWSIIFLSEVPWYAILPFAFLITFIENILPPSPSDSILLFMGTLVVLGKVDFVTLLLFATLGSTAGFIFMYFLGFKFGIKFIESNKLKFLTKESMEKPEKWFRKWGYYIIVINRFISGTRAVISFFAGMSKLNFKKITILSGISAAIWNFILIYLGVIFADNIEVIRDGIKTYGKIIFPAVLVILLFLILKYFFNKYVLKNKVV